jgi:hypothetical protein
MNVIKTNNFSTGFYELYINSYTTVIFDKNTVIKFCHKINGSRGNVLFDLTYHISLKQYDYNVKVLNNFNTHVLYEIVITSRITFLVCLSLLLIIFSFLSFNVIITTASSPNLRFNFCTKLRKKDSTSCEYKYCYVYNLKLKFHKSSFKQS